MDGSAKIKKVGGILLSNQPASILRFVCIALFACVVLVPVSKADPITYAFKGKTLFGTSVGFTYTSASGFISPTSFDDLYASQLSSCTNCLAWSFPVVQLQPQVPYFGDLLVFDDSHFVASVFGFQKGAFNNPGTYQSGGIFNLFNQGTLTVSDGTVKTPEPGTLGLLACGLVLLAGLVWRKRLGSPATAGG
jgi:PEP-CTERM motif